MLRRKPKPGRPKYVKVRHVACQLNLGQREDVWAGTPTTLAQRLLLLLALAYQWQVGVADVATAFLHAPIPESESIAIEPPTGEETNPEVVWLCKKALYGLRKAPAFFQEWLATQLESDGWVRCISDPCLFYLT